MLRKFIFYFLGYVRLYIASEHYEKAVTSLYGCSVIPIRQKKGRGDKSRFDFEKQDAERARRAFGNCGIEIINSKEIGFFSFLGRYRRRPGIAVGIFLLIISLAVSERFIWSINITGNDKVSTEQTLQLLEEHGIYVGTYIPSLDLHTLYNEILIDSEDFCWISVNIRGTVANVELRENERPLKLTPQKGKCANLVATSDGEITMINAHSGQSAVKVGDSIREGELLVSGLYEDKMGRTVHLYASGEVYAKVQREFYAEIPLEYEQKVYSGEKTYDFSLKIFSNTINILNNSRKTESKYDIIINNEHPYLFDRVRLPFSYELTEYSEYVTKTAVRTEQQAALIAYRSVGRQILESAGDGEILTKEYEGTLEDGVYKLRAVVSMNTNIAKIQEFIYNEG